jgi:hypothetical protein
MPQPTNVKDWPKLARLANLRQLDLMDVLPAFYATAEFVHHQNLQVLHALISPEGVVLALDALPEPMEALSASNKLVLVVHALLRNVPLAFIAIFSLVNALHCSHSMRNALEVIADLLLIASPIQTF